MKNITSCYYNVLYPHLMSLITRKQIKAKVSSLNAAFNRCSTKTETKRTQIGVIFQLLSADRNSSKSPGACDAISPSLTAGETAVRRPNISTTAARLQTTRVKVMVAFKQMPQNNALSDVDRRVGPSANALILMDAQGHRFRLDA